MKRMIIFTALMLVASGCASNAQNTTNAPAQSTNTNTAATPKTAAATTSEADHIAREKQVWDMLMKKDYDGFASMLADDQVEVESDGIHDKAGSIAGVKGTDFSTASLSDFKVLKVDDDAVVVTYLAKFSMPGANSAGYRQSTVWANRGGKWLAVFHQGTPVAAPSPSASPK